LDAKTRELIALPVAVTVRCDGGIVVHTETTLVFSARVMDAYEKI
jgi:AhpD family alkylhydroperoxidase